MKHICKYCDSHVEYGDLDTHADVHNKELAEPIPVKEMYREQCHKCPDCKEEKLVRRMGKMICQCCSYVTIMYSDLK